MEILIRQNYQDLLNYLPHIKTSLKEWKLAEIRLTGGSEKHFTVHRMADLVHSEFRDKEGKIYLCNEREVFLLIRWSQDSDPLELSRIIGKHLTSISYEIIVHEPTPEGLQRLEMRIEYEEPATPSSFTDLRYIRKENVILVATDDKYTRMLVKAGIPNNIAVKQVTDGRMILDEYRKYMPDILFLDIHLKGQNGLDLLKDIITLDSDAYVIMLSAKGSPENKNQPIYEDSKGFIPIPFSQGQLLEYLKKCPTLGIRKVQ